MAIAFRAAASVTYSSRNTSTTVNKPTGTVDGDIMVLTFFAGKSVLIDIFIDSIPTGWTQIGVENSVSEASAFHARLWVFWKRASSEGASYTIPHTNSLNTQAAIVSYSGCLASGSPVDVFSQNKANTGSTATATAITTTVTNTLLLYTGNNWDGSKTLTAPSGMTERFDDIVYCADEARAATGSTGTRTQTLPSSNPWQAFLIALKPASGAAYSLAAAAGSYSLTGTTTATRISRKIAAVASSYALTGTATTLTKLGNKSIVATAGSYALTGLPAALSKSANAVVFRAVSSINYAARQTTTVDKPAGTVDGDIMLAAFFQGYPSGAVDGAESIPSGWTLIGPYLSPAGEGLNGKFSLWWKRAAGEGASYTWAHTTQMQFTQMAIVSYSGCATIGSPIDVFSQNIGDLASGGTATALGVTTTVANTKLIYSGNNWDNTQTLTAPGGMVERFDQLVYFADENRPSAGATSNRLQAGVGAAWSACLVALKPSSGAAVYSLTAVPGSYTLTGTPATPTTRGKLSAVPGSYSLTGSPVTLGKSGTPLPILRSLSSVAYAQRFTSTVMTKPAGTVNGDVMVMTFFAGRSNLSDLTIDAFPTGWTQIGTQSTVTDVAFYGRIHVFWKRASGEGADYTFLHGNSLFTEGVIASYSGAVASGNPIDAFSQASANAGNIATATSVTGTGNTKLIYSGHNWDGTGTLTPPTGMTERYEGLVYYADQDWPDASATGARTQTLASSNPWQALLIALKGGPSFAATYTVTAVPGSYGLTGTTAATGRGLIARGGSYALTGTPVLMRKSAQKGLFATSGSYALDGLPATLTLTTITAVGGMSVWTGSAWVDKPVKVWTGSDWLQKTVKVWNGSAWV